MSTRSPGVLVRDLSGIRAGLALLLARRLTNPRVRRTTTRADRVLYVVLAATILLGLTATIGKNLLGGGYDYRATIAVWFRGVLTFRPDPDLMAGVPPVFQLHAMSAWVLAAIWPFSRLVHVWSAPIAYLWRPYIVYRRRPYALGEPEMSARGRT
ncbi:respiratory nitrate reductase subunit gamma [Nonomuraea sp. NPDC050451]|uniref:respiratory nitrate reductase subunit gamma n=1 Tax=Nonomuraea sp. NPDC050451 TaxID=3364364 RepID=UPI0037A7DFAD